MHPSANRKNVEVPDRCTVTVGHRPIGWEEFLRNSSAGVFHDVRWGEFLGSAVGNKVCASPQGETSESVASFN